MFNWFKKKENLKDIEFVDKTRMAYQYHPIIRASEVKPHFQKIQTEGGKKFAFSACPGMVDLRNAGYIVPAWDDINIFANESGCMVTIGGGEKRKTMFDTPKPMEPSIGKGIFTPFDNIPLQVFNLNSPWHLFSNKKDISCIIQSAWFHSSFLNDIYIYPGIVDYDNFTTMNLIMSPRRKCNITIKAGEPLYQILPFYNIKEGISAGYGPADDYQRDRINSVYSTTQQWYRKYANTKRVTSLEEEK